MCMCAYCVHSVVWEGRGRCGEWVISQLHASESIHGMYDVTSGCSIACSYAVNGEIGRWAFEMCA